MSIVTLKLREIEAGAFQYAEKEIDEVCKQIMNETEHKSSIYEKEIEYLNEHLSSLYELRESLYINLRRRYNLFGKNIRVVNDVCFIINK